MLFECQKCGWCCTHIGEPIRLQTDHLWYNIKFGKTFPIILPFENVILSNLASKKGEKADFPIGEFWVDESRKCIILLDYIFPKEKCDFHDQQRSECAVYSGRSTICRMFPITSLRTIDVPEVKCSVNTANCPSAISLFGKSKDMHDKVECPSGQTFSSIFGLQLQDAAMMEVYLDSANFYMHNLAKAGKIRLQLFRPNRISRVLAKYPKIKFEDLFKELEGKDFRSFLKPIFIDKVREDNDEAVRRGLPGVDVNAVASWIEEHWS